MQKAVFHCVSVRVHIDVISEGILLGISYNYFFSAAYLFLTISEQKIHGKFDRRLLSTVCSFVCLQVLALNKDFFGHSMIFSYQVLPTAKLSDSKHC